MELLGAGWILWERRIVVAIGVVVAVAAGLLAGRASGASPGDPIPGTGTVRVVLDTADSQLLKAAPRGADSLPMRASLLADTLASSAGKTLVARESGVDPLDLVVVIPAATKDPTSETPLVKRIAKVTASVHAPYVVEVSVDDVTPIISIKANAPDDAHVRRLTAAAVASLRSLLVAGDGSDSQGFVLDTVAPVRVERTPVESHAAALMLGAALAVFCFWCLAVVVVVAAWRRSRGLAAAPELVTGREPA
jgi:hypothetical protein